MKFKANTRRRAIEYEKDLVQQWKKNRIFEKSVEMRPIDNSFVFYDGPPFITGVPHHGTLLSSVVKDVVPRYQTMNGKRVERVWGWDCHGLPAENYVEKKLGITDRHDIGTKISLADYIKTARESMVQTSSLWEDTVDRIGRWVDFKGAYKTMDKKYMESVWWAFKTLYEKGKIYEGERVLMYDTKWATPLSKAEVTMDAGAYIDVTDPSVFVKFKLSGENTTLLAWTTTPWTLPANTALAVNDDVEYAEIELETKYRKVFLISGKHAFASISYFPKLKSKLEDLGFDVTIIDHVNYDNPNLADNLSNLERYDFSNSHVITHSLGASTFLKWLDGNNVKVQSLTMFAPGYPGVSHKSKNQDWLTHSGYVGFNVDFDKIKTQIINRPTIIYSNEAQDRFDDFIKLGKKLNAKMVFEPGKEHFFAEDKTSEPNYKISFNDRFILAKETIKQVLTDNKHNKLDFKIIRILSGKDLVGKSYEPLFDDRGENAHKIWAADYVTTESGTGIVHIAPAYGEEDFELARKNKIPVVHVVDDYGKYTETEWIGNDIWEINKTVAKTLLERGIVWKIEYIRHEYPHNPRTGNRLIYRAHPSWFMDIDGQRTEMLEENTEHINWFPEYIKHGRFEKNIQQAPDWNLSRDRFWASAMPVWKGVDSDGKEHIKVVGSYAELKELSGIELEDYHRPWVDDIKFEIDGVKYSRIDKVLDCWFESGSMPFAQFHYPFENVEKFEQNFPGDFIVEYVGQVRAWFYYVHAVSVGIFGHNAFKNVIVTGNIAVN
jgi:isoleucyl-tRNA synthetase